MLTIQWGTRVSMDIVTALCQTVPCSPPPAYGDGRVGKMRRRQPRRGLLPALAVDYVYYSLILGSMDTSVEFNYVRKEN